MSDSPLAPERYLTAIADDATLSATTAEAGAGRALSTCPGWSTEDLLAHLGTLHRRVAAMVVASRPTRVTADELPPPPPADKRNRWFRDGAAGLVAALTVAGTRRPCWTLDDPDGVSGFWFRRMAQETLMHRIDAELALGPPSEIAPELAADGIDELWNVHLPRRLRRAAIPGLALEGLVETTDAGASWRVSLTPEAVRLGDAGAPDATMSGPAAPLLCYLWNRGDGAALSFDGDAAVFSQWADLVQM